jgi:hypothetical protein
LVYGPVYGFIGSVYGAMCGCIWLGVRIGTVYGAVYGRNWLGVRAGVRV